jgi:hypothetical protein
MAQRVIFVFLDGVGLAPASTANPLSTAATPAIHRLLGGPLTLEQLQRSSTLLLKSIDANLGVPGLPQSGTGQVALLAGVNAPALVGRHQPHTPPVALRELLAEQSIFRRAQALGRRATFANLFTPGYWQALATRRLRRSASVIAAEGAGLAFRSPDDFAAGRAVPWDITGDSLRTQGVDLPTISPARAGGILTVLAEDNDLVFFECFLPDLAGHGRPPLSDEAAIERIDELLGGLLPALNARTSLLITSDHGNVEDRLVPNHTRNPVPLLVAGPAADHFAAVETIADVAAAILAVLGAAS